LANLSLEFGAIKLYEASITSIIIIIITIIIIIITVMTIIIIIRFNSLFLYVLKQQADGLLGYKVNTRKRKKQKKHVLTN
jgi:uncharacterized membrane protein (UPF0182 family)